MTERTANRISFILLICMVVTLLAGFVACLCTSYGKDDTLKYYGHYHIYDMTANADNTYMPLSCTFIDIDGKTYPKTIWLDGNNGQGSFNSKTWYIAHVVSTHDEESGHISYKMCSCSGGHNIEGSVWDKDPYAVHSVSFFAERGISIFKDFYNYYKDDPRVTFVGKY